MRKTPWFDAIKHKPTRVGMYEFNDGMLGGKVFRLAWDGYRWMFKDGFEWTPYFRDKWRGLTKPAKEKA